MIVGVLCYMHVESRIHESRLPAFAGARSIRTHNKFKTDFANDDAENAIIKHLFLFHSIHRVVGSWCAATVAVVVVVCM